MVFISVMNRGGKMDKQIFTLKNVLLHLTRLIGLDVNENSPSSNHDISRGRTAAKKEEVIFDVNIIRAAPKEGLPGYIPPPPKKKKSKLKKRYFIDTISNILRDSPFSRYAPLNRLMISTLEF